jgi:hypothetical protein
MNATEPQRREVRRAVDDPARLAEAARIVRRALARIDPVALARIEREVVLKRDVR